MTTRLRSKAAASALLALAALATPLVAIAAAGHETTAAATESKQNALKSSMRKLWADHVIWTREYIVAAVAGTPDASEAEGRLLRNQVDIAEAFVPYYGKDTGARLGKLLKEHILIASEVVASAKAGDTPKQQEADERWHDNATDIAVFLSIANPVWSKTALVDMFAEHLALTAKQAESRIHKQWSADISAFDRIFEQAMMMADDFSNGIIKQFPRQF